MKDYVSGETILLSLMEAVFQGRIYCNAQQYTYDPDISQ